MCRNNCGRPATQIHHIGSPLRVQEQFFDFIVGTLHTRITPACAGTIYSYYPFFRRTLDHPCVCRNNYYTLYFLFPLLGSPLRVQEQWVRCMKSIHIVGITPACAGTIHKNKFVLLFRRDHPCVCRNNKNLRILHQAVQGSPLRVQEQCNSVCLPLRFPGITPACAGTI